jgi:hypothetical protein
MFYKMRWHTEHKHLYTHTHEKKKFSPVSYRYLEQVCNRT